MNAAQMAKLQRKVAKQVSAKFAKEDEERLNAERELEAEIRSNIIELQKLHEKRGVCVCAHDHVLYALRDDTGEFYVLPMEESDLQFHGMQCVSAKNGKTYYMSTEQGHAEQARLMKWVASKYGAIRYGLVAQAKEDVRKKVNGLFMLGGVMEEFRKEFPTKSVFDLKTAVEAMDMMLGAKHVRGT